MTAFRLPLNGELGQFLKRARKVNRLTQQELSRLSGVSEAEICRIENNLRIPNFLIVGRLEEALREVSRICPRCSGNLFLEPDTAVNGLEKWCINCGYREDLKNEFTWKPRIIKRQIATSRV